MVMDVKDIALTADYVRRLCHWFKIMECGHRYVTCRHDHISCQWSLCVFLVRELCAWKLLMGFVRTKYDLGLCAWEYCILLCAYRRFTDAVIESSSACPISLVSSINGHQSRQLFEWIEFCVLNQSRQISQWTSVPSAIWIRSQRTIILAQRLNARHLQRIRSLGSSERALSPDIVW